MIDELLLLSGNDIPFPAAQLVIHPPTIKEIAYITEQKFWIGCQLLKFNKENLINQDKLNLSNQTNFNIIMSMIQGKTPESQEAKINILSLLTLLFPNKRIILDKKVIQLYDIEDENIINEINNNNFEIFKQMIIEIFCLTNEENKQYNPSGELAKKIADKFAQARARRAKLAPDHANEKISLLNRYISILAVGQQKNINDLMNYTIYQLMDEFKRFNLKSQYDTWVKYKIAGAQNLDDPQDWLKDIHSNKNDSSQDDGWNQFVN